MNTFWPGTFRALAIVGVYAWVIDAGRGSGQTLDSILVATFISFVVWGAGR